MAWLQKPKRREPIGPKQCHRCGKRPGSIQLTSVAEGEQRDMPLWLCDDCARALRNDPRRS